MASQGRKRASAYARDRDDRRPVDRLRCAIPVGLGSESPPTSHCTPCQSAKESCCAMATMSPSWLSARWSMSLRAQRPRAGARRHRGCGVRRAIRQTARPRRHRRAGQPLPAPSSPSRKTRCSADSVPRVLELLSDEGIDIPVRHLGVPDRIFEQASQARLREMAGLTPDGVIAAVRQALKARPAAPATTEIFSTL